MNIEQRQDMKDRFDHVHGHDIDREMRVLRGRQVDEDGNPIEQPEEPAREEGEEE